jgi:hypothetical protein
MTLTELVPSLDLCQRLKAAGFPQDTALRWSMQHEPHIPDVEPTWMPIAFNEPILCAAPTAEEILKELPETYDSDYYLSAVLRKGYAHVGWYDWDDEYLGHVDEGEGQSLVQAAALAFLWWKEQK